MPILSLARREKFWPWNYPSKSIVAASIMRKNRSVFLALLTFSLFSLSASPYHSVKSFKKTSPGSILLDVTFHRQVEKNYACGAALLHSVLSWWGSKTTQLRILTKYPPNNKEKGYSLGEMKRIVKQYSLKSFVIGGTSDFIRKQIDAGRPVIVPVKLQYDADELAKHGLSSADYDKVTKKYDLVFDHYLAVIGYAKNSFVVIDPARGIYKIEIEKFEDIWRHHQNATLLISS